MTYIIDIVIIVFLFALFGVSHTILASSSIKKRIIENAGNKIAFYRLFYNIISVIIFLAIYEIAPKPGLIIYDLPYPYDLVTIGLSDTLMEKSFLVFHRLFDITRALMTQRN